MTIQALINTLDAFRDEYNTSTDKDVQKLCGFIRNTIDGLQSYLNYFSNSKSRIETSQQYYTDTLSSINKLLEDSENPDSPQEPSDNNDES